MAIADAPLPVKLRTPDHPTLRLIGLALLAGWVSFWIKSIGDFLFATLDLTWIPAWSFLGLDFFHCYLGVKEWMNGMNPYLVDIGDFRGTGQFVGRYAAPPITLPLFAWTRWFDPYVATIIWITIIAAVMCYAVIVCMRVRRALGLWMPPLPLALAVVLWSMPVLFSMERGNLDVWVLITLFLAIRLMRSGGWVKEVLAGLVLAVGAWTKIYPGVFIFALLPFGKWRASLACLVGVVLIGIVPLTVTRQFFLNASHLDDNRVAPLEEVAAWLEQPTFEPFSGTLRVESFSHSLTSYWAVVFGHTPLGSVPGFLGAAALLGPLFLIGAYRVWRSPRRDALFLPFTFWSLTLGTFGLPLSHDYNLFFLLLTAISLWDKRDPILVHLLMVPTLIWWQPLQLPIGINTFIYLKFLSLLPVSVMLFLRAGKARAEQGRDSAAAGKIATAAAPPPDVQPAQA